MKKRLLHVTMYYLPLGGGQQNYIHDLNKHLAKFDYEIDVLQANKPDVPADNVYHLFNHSIIQRGLFFLLRRVAMGEWFVFNLYLLLKRNFLKNYDVIICHYPFHYPVLKWHKNVIVLSHGVDWPIKPKNICDYYKKWIAGWIGNAGVKIVANDTDFLRQIGMRIGCGSSYFKEVKKHIWFIPNCSDSSYYINSNRKRKNVVIVPRNVRKARGIDLAIRSWGEFIRDFPKWELWIVGGYEEKDDYYQYCRSLIDELAIGNSVKFLGSVASSKMRDVYNYSMVTLIPTIKFEGTSLSAIESMMCGTPVISTKIGGLCDLPTYKCELDSHNIAMELRNVLKEWKKYSEKQHTETIRNFDISNWIKTWKTVIES